MKNNIKKLLAALIIAVSIIMLYQVINISINATTTIKEHYHNKVGKLYMWDANLLFLFKEYNVKPERREDLLIDIIQWSGVAEAVNNDMTYPYLFPNIGLSNYNVPYIQIRRDARRALLNKEELNVEHHIQFLEAKLTYILHYDAILGIDSFTSEESKALIGTDVNKVKINYFTTVLLKGNKMVFESEQREYLEELFYELNLQKYYGESNRK